MVHWYSSGTVYTVHCTMHIIKDCSRAIIFQLPQNDISYSRNWKACLLLYALRDAYKSRD